MRRAFGMAVLAVVIASGIPAIAHHSNPLYFDMTKAITLEGEVLRVEWINPHILLFLQSKNDKGELETWTLQGAFTEQRDASGGLEGAAATGRFDRRSRVASSQPAVSERRADGPADATR